MSNKTVYNYVIKQEGQSDIVIQASKVEFHYDDNRVLLFVDADDNTIATHYAQSGSTVLRGSVA